MKRVLFFIASIFTLSLSMAFAQEDSMELAVLRDKHREFKNGAHIYYSERFPEGTKEYANMMAAADTYIDFFASQDLSSAPDWELPIIDMVKQGLYTNAISRYDRRNLLGEYTEGSELYPIIERYVMLLEFSGIRQNAIKALTVIQGVADKETTSIRVMPTLISLASDLRQYSLTDQYFDAFLERSAGNPESVAKIYALRAQVCMRRSRPNEANRLATRAIAIYDSLAQANDNPKYCALDRARLHQTQGSILYRLDDLQGSLKNVYSSFACYEAAAEENFSADMLERLRAYYSMASLATDLKDYKLADDFYQNVAQYGSWLFEGNAYQQAKFVFNTTRLRGLTLVTENRMDEAAREYQLSAAALDDMERLAPGTNIQYFQNLNFNIASLYYTAGNLEMALVYDKKILNMLLQDNQTEEHRHNVDLAYIYKYIGNCYWAMGYNKYLANNKKKSKEIMRMYQDAQRHYQMALRHFSKDTEARAKAELAQLILQGLEKPQAMPKHF